MFRIETAGIAGERIGSGMISRFDHGSSSDAATMPLLPSFANADGFSDVRPRRASEFGVNQPNGLRRKPQQQEPGKKLWLAEAFTREIWAHKVEPSVLP